MASEQDALRFEARDGGERSETWKPSIGISIVWTLASALLTIGAVGLFLLANDVLTGSADPVGQGLVEIDRSEPSQVSMSLHGPGLLLLFGIGVGILLVHEAVHAAAFRYFGGRPQVGAALVNKILPVLYCSAPGYVFTRRQFAVIVLAPAIVITAAGLVLMPTTGLGMWLIVPLAINLGGAVGDFWFAGLLLQRPPGTTVEDLKDGIRFYYPTPSREP